MITKTVFISGSRHLSHLNLEVKRRLERIISQKFKIIIGDANGIDKAVQKFLHTQSYPNVEIYYTGLQPRNNIAVWSSKRLNTRKYPTLHDFIERDKKLAQDCDYGFMIWDCKSHGTLRNAYMLTFLEKPFLIFINPYKEFIRITPSNQSTIIDFMKDQLICKMPEEERDYALEMLQETQRKEHQPTFL